MLVTVDAVIFKQTANNLLQVLLIKRGNPPFEGHYALPGGFPEMDELLVDAAKRELREETSIHGIELQPLGTFDGINRDPRDRNISVAFYGFEKHNLEPKANDDAIEAQWFFIDKLPPLAFDHHEIIASAIQKVESELQEE